MSGLSAGAGASGETDACADSDSAGCEAEHAAARSMAKQTITANTAFIFDLISRSFQIYTMINANDGICKLKKGFIGLPLLGDGRPRGRDGVSAWPAREDRF
jgi:hypothetical protein